MLSLFVLMKTNKKIIIFVYLFVSFVLTSAFCEEPPSKFPPCDTSLERQSWNNCYKKVTFGDGFKYHGEWNRGLFHGKGKFITTEGFIEEGEWIEGSLKWQSKYYYKRHFLAIPPVIPPFLRSTLVGINYEKSRQSFLLKFFWEIWNKYIKFRT